MRAIIYKRRSKLEWHGESRKPLYYVWKGMLKRCRSPQHKSHQYYFDKGIKVCKSWDQSYIAFRDWAMQNGYRQGLEIDRIKNELGYSPSNCRFVTASVNQNNKSDNHYLLAYGEKKTIAQWIADPRCRVNRNAFRMRIFYGWEPERALSTPWLPRGKKRTAIPRPLK
jgi:hypothetical protein